MNPISTIWLFSAELHLLSKNLCLSFCWLNLFVPCPGNLLCMFLSCFNIRVSFYYYHCPFLYLVSQMINPLLFVPDIIQNSKQRCHGDRRPRDYSHMQGPWSCEEGISASSSLHQATALWSTNHARSNTCPWHSHAIYHTTKAISRNPTIIYTSICQSSWLHWRVCKYQYPPHDELPIHEHLGCPALPQVWRGNFPEQYRVRTGFFLQESTETLNISKNVRRET